MELLLKRIFNKIKKHTVGLELSEFSKYKNLFKGRTGLEIGGPSGIFNEGQILPIYPVADQVDGVNFSTQTVWENTIHVGNTYKYGLSGLGYQYILEASDLSEIPDQKYDFLLSSHSLEHCANPLKALKEWKRVIRDQGIIVLVLPDKRVTFDHRRPVTLFSHLVDDFNAGTEESDETHLDEVLKLHDLTKDRGVKTFDEFLIRSKSNIENRCIHHHVFDMNLVEEILDYLDMEILFTTSSVLNLVAVARKK